MPSSPLARLLLGIALLFLAYLGLSVVAMLTQLADAADRLYLGAGQWVFWCLLALIAGLVAWPTVQLLRLPSALRHPDSNDPEALARYHQRLRECLQRNPRLEGLPLNDDAALAPALARLKQLADEEVRKVAASVLASTALLQNGRLDGLIVLASQVRLVWRVARIYGLRPSLGQISYLYSQVGACMLIASSLEDMDFAELSAPLVQAATPSALASLPGLGGLGQLLVNSLASGSANAFLTLRVGLVAQAFCAPLHAPDRAAVRQGATRQAVAMLGQITRDCGTQITQAVHHRIKESLQQTSQAAVDGVKSAAQGLGQATRSAAQSTGQRFSQATQQVRQAGLAAADTTLDAADALRRGSQATVRVGRNQWQSAVQAIKGSEQPPAPRMDETPK